MNPLYVTLDPSCFHSEERKYFNEVDAINEVDRLDKHHNIDRTDRVD